MTMKPPMTRADLDRLSRKADLAMKRIKRREYWCNVRRIFWPLSWQVWVGLLIVLCLLGASYVFDQTFGV